MNVPTPEQRLAALYDLLDSHNQLKDANEDQGWARALEKLSATLDAEGAVYFSYLPATRQLLARHAIGQAAAKAATLPMDLSGICGWVAARREPALVDDAGQDGRFREELDGLSGSKTRSVLAVPLLDRLDLVGVAEFLNKRSGPFTADDLSFLAAACRATATALRALRFENTMDRISAHNASLLENLTGGFVAVDMRGRIILCNQAARRILKMGSDVPPGTPADQALANVPRLTAILSETISSRQVVKRREFQWEFQGKVRCLGYSTLLIQDPQGKLSGAGVTFQDITDIQR